MQARRAARVVSNNSAMPSDMAIGIGLTPCAFVETLVMKIIHDFDQVDAIDYGMLNQ